MSLNPDLTNVVPEAIIDFLEKNESNFITMWQEQTIQDQADIHKEKVKENGYLMYALIKNTLLDTVTMDDVKHLAYKVAKERVEANINIGDFVYNVNIGRSILIKFVLQAGVNSNQLSIIVDKINTKFDQFCYHAVSQYTEIKNSELEEKKLFINQTHKDKLAILGQMSSSFVHEFRNPLTSIIGFNKLLRTEYPTLKYLDIIELELDQLKFRITQFLHTSKMATIESPKEIFILSDVLDEILSFLYPSIVDSDVLIFTDTDAKINIEAHKDEIKQVFLNVLFNSIDAVMQRQKPREIHLRCFIEDERVIIEVSNNGPMIPLDVQETIFEPFYTTKELGTGIGLFVCRKIIEKHSGELTCSSDEQKTTFRISLPFNKTHA
ncbi:histidine kinase N-terminal domain-containing protein [Halalkalibacter alkaliphilus]|uniref:histidine kinase n=2 Tax=Bacillaceae TaxID=186817 RepID=A0A9X1ZWN6_9BACI|nr:histidine kinase N-terminal domain-containing protein [Halalkalibacter alkaliphilus]MCL7746904.1 ATP-binding protein [Halalkalibacter alkaliphilus]